MNDEPNRPQFAVAVASFEAAALPPALLATTVK
jgi:hypothetical protein